MNNNKQKGFTLIELLAVIIILGVLMLIAIPSVTEYISSSRKRAYIATIHSYADSVLLKLNSMDYTLTNANTTYYVPAECINMERGGKSPYGEWVEAYVVVEFTGNKYNYYWTSYDTANMGVNLMRVNDITPNDIVANVTNIEKRTLNGDTLTGTINSATCDPSSIIIESPEPTSTIEGCFAFNSSAQSISNYYDYEGNDPGNNPCPRDVVIPSTIAGTEVLKINNSAFQGKSLTSVVIPDTVTNIYLMAFTNNKLTSLVLPNSVVSIADYTFEGNDIASLTLPNSLTSIGSGAFNGNELTSLTIPNSVTSIGSNAFQDNKLTSIVIPSSITSISNGTFINNLLTNVTIPDSVTSIGNYAFNNNQLTSVTIKGKSNSTEFASYGTTIWGWASGYNDSNIIWNG